MTRELAALSLSAACLAAGWSGLWISGGPLPSATPEPPSAGARAATEPLALERYARWVLERTPGDLREVAAARRALQRALGDAQRPTGDAEAQTLKLRSLQMEVESRWRLDLVEHWFAYRRHRALRDWRRARSALRAILSATERAHPDHKLARQLLEQTAGR